MHGQRDMIGTEAYLHERCVIVRQKNPHAIEHDIAVDYLLREVAETCGVWLAEMNSDRFDSFISILVARRNAIHAGVPAGVTIGAPAQFKATLPLPLPEPEPEPVALAAPASAPAPAAPKPKINMAARGQNAGALHMPGKDIQLHRERLKLSQTELALKLGLKSGSAVCVWENENNWPNGRQYRKLRELFGLPVPEGA